MTKPWVSEQAGLARDDPLAATPPFEATFGLWRGGLIHHLPGRGIRQQHQLDGTRDGLKGRLVCSEAHLTVCSEALIFSDLVHQR